MKRSTKLAAAVIGLAVLVVPITALSVSSAGAATAAACDEGHWPATVQGQPERLHAGSTDGYYVWHDKYGWHLRTTTPQHSPHVFTGRIVSSDNIRSVTFVRDENDDRATVSGHVLSFRFVTFAGIDGVNFRVGCTNSVTFELKLAGNWVPAYRMFLGHDGRAPHNPLTVSRVP
ncbi:MAG: hypothetical protein E6G46_02675 [Actinobacteria bacterium]|nr:MAG: hypothetical protein E6G46_02675 [Actinomycetota bacterium]